MIEVEARGSFDNTENFLKRINKGDIFSSLDGYGQAGVRALSAATPSRSGATSASWYYEIKRRRGSYSVIWRNRNVVDGVPIAILIQYGHGTRNGGYVQGRDYINPAMRSIFDNMANDVWKEVTRK